MGFDFDMSGKVAVITGAGSGLGKDIAFRLAEQGVTVVLAGRREVRINEVADEIKGMGTESTAVATDVTDAGSVKNLIQTALDNFGRIDFLVNNAGISLPSLVKDMTEEQWDGVLNTNLKGTFLCCREVINHMIAQKFGRIVNVSSVAGYGGWVTRANYCSSKHGMAGFTKTLAGEVVENGIRVNAVAPGLIESGVGEKLRNNDPVMFETLAGRIPMKRAGRAEEISYTALFLLSEASSFMTGQTIFVDGGQTALAV